MHAILFSLKRTHLRALSKTRPLTGIFGLTPARYDMLFAIATHAEFGLSQSRLCRILGLSGATVSRMARSLEELGLISRSPSLIDRRCLDLRLTNEGADRLELAMSALVDTGAIELLVTCAFASKWRAPSAINELLAFEAHLYVARRNLGDPATLRYAWHPDDCDPDDYDSDDYN